MSRKSYVVLVAGLVRRDPSAGFERADLDLAALADAAEQGGAPALAVGTDGPLFGVGLDELHRIAPHRKVPVLRLDYVLDVRQLYASRLAGADAVLVSAGMLETPHLERLVQAARSMHMHAVVESRDQSDLARALPVAGAIHGLGDLTGETGTWDVTRLVSLAAQVPARVTSVALSGVRSREDVAALHGKVDAALVTAPWLGVPDPATVASMFGE
jgi:indole-3-glycerol phosphate synthase